LRISRAIFSFTTLIWSLVLVAAFVLLALPLLRNVIAYYTWEKVPCWFSPETRTSYFDRDGRRYATTTPDFWSTLDVSTSAVAVNAIKGPPNAYCYVSRSAPYQAVQSLDAHKNWPMALPRIAMFSAVLAVATVITVAAKKAKRRQQKVPG